MSEEGLFRGVVPPLITPFKESGDLHEGGIGAVIEHVLSGGVHGLFICGSYGSFPLMTDDERKKVAEIIIDRVNGRAPVITHVGTPGTRRSLELARHAAGIGSSAVASLVPFYYSGSGYNDDHVVRHFAALAEAVSIPVHLYNNPNATNFNVSLGLLKRLAGIGVTGYKDSSRDLIAFTEAVIEVTPQHPTFNFLSGTAGLMGPMHFAGAQGHVAGTANVFPQLCVDTYDALMTEDWEKARELQSVIVEVRKLQGIDGSRPAGCYSILKMLGVDAGTVRAPWLEMSLESQTRVRAKLGDLGLL